MYLYLERHVDLDQRPQSRLWVGKLSDKTVSSLCQLQPHTHALDGYLARVSAAVLRPSPGPGSVPAASSLPQSCAAWRTNGNGLAQPLILDAMLHILSVADAPTPPQSSHALRYPGGRAGAPS